MCFAVKLYFMIFFAVCKYKIRNRLLIVTSTNWDSDSGFVTDLYFGNVLLLNFIFIWIVYILQLYTHDKIEDWQIDVCHPLFNNSQ